MCFICKKDQSHLKRHLIRKYSNHEDVQNMIRLSAVSENSREPMKNILYAGDFQFYNTDKERNKGDFRVARRPKNMKNASDFTACPRIRKGLFNVLDYALHIKSCLNIKTRGCKNLTSLGRRMMLDCASNADNIMRHRILPRMRNDKVLRAIKYDELLVEYGNERCCHLRELYHKENICVQLRRLARLKIAVGVNKFSEILVPGNSLKVIKAIELLSTDKRKDPNGEFLTYPTLAQNLAGLVKAICKTFETMCIRKNELNIIETAKLFMQVFVEDYKTRLS